MQAGLVAGSRQEPNIKRRYVAISLGVLLIALLAGSYLLWRTLSVGESGSPASQGELVPSTKATESEAAGVGFGAKAVTRPRYQYLGTWSHRPLLNGADRVDPETPPVYALLLLDKETGLYFAPIFAAVDYTEYNLAEQIAWGLDGYEKAMKNRALRVKAEAVSDAGSVVISSATVLGDGSLRIVVRDRSLLASAGRSVTYARGPSAASVWTAEVQP